LGVETGSASREAPELTDGAGYGMFRPMGSFTIVDERASLVLLGSFNPGIFHPEWLRRVNLATAGETTKNPELITAELAILPVADLRVEVHLNRLQITGPAASATRMHELAQGTLERLEHVPVTALGMNRHTHFQAPDEATWHAVGHTLVPKAVWKNFLDDPRTKSVTVQGKRAASTATMVFITVEPSSRVQPGVHINVNEHHDVEPHLASVALEHMAEWQDAQSWGRRMGEELLSKCSAT
jgi:hypothetical protein